MSAAASPRPWRVGTKVARNIYDVNDVGIVMVPNADDARLIVDAVNGFAPRDQTELEQSAAKAVVELLTCFRLYDVDVRGRGARGCIYRAIENVAPRAAKMLHDGEEPSFIVEQLYPEHADE